MQEEMSKDFFLIGALPWNHFGRKNIGYLYAILHGANIIWDFDDDNTFLAKHHMSEIVPGANAPYSGRNSTTVQAIVNPFVTVLEASDYGNKSMLSFNPYPLMGCPSKPWKYITVRTL